MQATRTETKTEIMGKTLNASSRASLYLIDKLEAEGQLSREEWIRIFSCPDTDLLSYAAEKASAIRDRVFGKEIFTRGLIEFTSYCRNDCLYCGIRRSNKKADRYRLAKEEILACCREGYPLGFRTFVLQGGEDPYYSDEYIAEIIAAIHEEFPDCAITLSAGERSRKTYQRWFDAGADRYLLRHETADPNHYRLLHPNELSLENRMRCLWDLKEIGFLTGTGFMVGSPGQTPEALAADMLFIREFEPDMIGIGPFIPHHDTPFGSEPGGTVEKTLLCIALLRIMMPQALIPATTALGTIAPDGRERGILAGANVVMPNLSPIAVRKKYELYDNKICTGEESAQCRNCLSMRMDLIGYELTTARGAVPLHERNRSFVTQRTAVQSHHGYAIR